MWKSIILIHVIQVIFVVLHPSEYLDKVLLKDYHKKTNNFWVFDESLERGRQPHLESRHMCQVFSWGEPKDKEKH